MVQKRLLIRERRRVLPREGFSWVDRRFLREFAPALSRDALLLYFFFAAVSDKDGLSYYKEASIAVRLRLQETQVVVARNELVDHDLLAFRAPLTQVLSLPPPRLETGGPARLGELLDGLKQSPSQFALPGGSRPPSAPAPTGAGGGPQP